MHIPPRFDETFLTWLRRETELAWASYPTRSMDEYRLAGVGGFDWQPDTRWCGGLKDDEIRAFEGRWGFPLPNDMRLYLRMLHATDRPMAGAGFGPTGELEPRMHPGFYHWLDDAELMHARVARAGREIVDAVHSFGLWLNAWGPRPPSPRERRARIETMLLRAPPLIPLHGHRFLVAAFADGGNPVLSIFGSDVLLYGRDLREYLLHELGTVLSLQPNVNGGPGTLALDVHVPFWGDFVPAVAREVRLVATAH